MASDYCSLWTPVTPEASKARCRPWGIGGGVGDIASGILHSLGGRPWGIEGGVGIWPPVSYTLLVKHSAPLMLALN